MTKLYYGTEEIPCEVISIEKKEDVVVINLLPTDFLFFELNEMPCHKYPKWIYIDEDYTRAYYIHELLSDIPLDIGNYSIELILREKL